MNGVARGVAMVLALGGCAQVELPPLSARVTIEETGEVIGSPHVFALSGRFDDAVFVFLDNGDRLLFSLGNEVPQGPFVPVEPWDGPAPLLTAAYQVVETSGSGIRNLCASDARSEGGLMLRARSWDTDDNIDGLVGTVRVRFVGCEESREGLALADVTFVVELPAP